MDDINENVGFTNEVKPYSMLIDVFKEMTNHLEGHCTVIDINEIRACLNDNIVKTKKRAADELNQSNIEGTGEFISDIFPSTKKLKPTAQSIINDLQNNFYKKSFVDDRLNQSFNTIAIGLTYF